MKTLLQLAGTLAVAYTLLLIGVYVFQSRLIYFPNFASSNPDANPGYLGFSYEDVRFSTKDGIDLHGWFVPAEPARGVLLFMHGNAGNITHRLDSIAQFHRLGLSVFIFDYRGYGQSSGEPTEAGTYADATAAWHFLIHDRGISPKQIVLFGRSLGGAIAAELATKVEPAALIIESAFTSVPDVAAKHYWFLPVRLLARIRYDTGAHLARVEAPVLVVHSREDEIISFSNGERLFDTAGEPKSFLELQGGHNDGFIVSEPAYSGGIDRFLDKYLATRGQLR